LDCTSLNFICIPHRISTPVINIFGCVHSNGNSNVNSVYSPVAVTEEELWSSANMPWIGLLVQTVMHNSVHMAKVTGNFTLQSTPPESTKLKCSEISTLQNRQIKMQLHAKI